MAELIADTIDFAAYLRETEPASKIRTASAFEEDVIAEFAARTDARKPEMFSTKLRGLIEFRPGEVTAWAGYSGHGKSLFTGQVALDLCVQRERVLLVSLEMQPSKTLARMARQAFATARPTPAQIAHFGKWSDGRLWVFDHLGRISPALGLAVCRYFADKLDGCHVVLDSMMMVCESEESIDEQKQFVTDLVRLAVETGLHVHLVTHCRKPQSGDDRPPTKYDVRGSAAITDQAANVVTVWKNKPKAKKLELNQHDIEAQAEPDTRVAVEKQRNGAWEGSCKLWWDEASFRFIDDRTTRVEPYHLEAA